MTTAELVSDLARAKSLLSTDQYTCVLVKQDSVLTARTPGIAPMIDFITAGIELNGYVAADKVVGKAAALLFAKAGIKEVYAPLGSQRALEVLANIGIATQIDNIVPQILNTQRTHSCPMEQLVADTADPTTGFIRLSAAVAERRAALNTTQTFTAPEKKRQEND